jgi:hypothetical protein
MANLPAFVRFNKSRLVSNSPTTATESKALIQHVRRIPAQRWEFVLTTVPLNKDQIRQLMPWVFRQNGRYGVFYTKIPVYSKPRGLSSGSPTVRSLATAGSTQVQMQGFSGPVTGQLLTGDFIRFSNHTKVYQVTADANSNVSGQLTIQIFPQLCADLPIGTAAIVKDVPFTVRLVRDAQEFESAVSGSGFSTFELDVIEVL